MTDEAKKPCDCTGCAMMLQVQRQANQQLASIGGADFQSNFACRRVSSAKPEAPTEKDAPMPSPRPPSWDCGSCRTICTGEKPCQCCLAKRCQAQWTSASLGIEHTCKLTGWHSGPHRDRDASWPRMDKPAGPESVSALVVEPPAKAPMDRLGEVPRAMRALALQIAYGATRPGRAPGCWQRLTRAELIGKALRHLIDAASGEVLDESGRSHLVAAMTDCAFAVEMEGQA